jgi:hypothetical protein
MSVLAQARGILAVLSPQTGTRATGAVTAIASSAPVVLQRGEYLSPLVPAVSGAAPQLAPERVFKVAENPATSDGSWTVAASPGTAVLIESNIGGARHNLSAPTTFRWDPPLDGLTPTAQLVATMTDGADPTFSEGLKNAVIFQEVGPSRSLDIFRSKLGAFPAAMLIWTGSQPADGVTLPRTRRAQQMGASSQLWKELYVLQIIVSLDTSQHARRQQGLAILDDVTGWLTDRRSVDGYVVSAPDGIQLMARFLDTGGREPGPFYQNFAVYGLRLAATHAFTRTDTRTYNDWLKTKLDATTSEANAPTDLSDKVVVNDYTFEMD